VRATVLFVPRLIIAGIYAEYNDASRTLIDGHYPNRKHVAAIERVFVTSCRVRVVHGRHRERPTSEFSEFSATVVLISRRNDRANTFTYVH